MRECEEKKEAFEENKEKNEKEANEDIGLFVEFMKFLIQRGIFNKNIFLYLLNNKSVLG